LKKISGNLKGDIMFERLVALIGDEALNKIKSKKIVVLGLGGVGSYALEGIIRSGVENVVIIDADKIDITNLNRQLMTNQKNIGFLKVDILENRIKEINPDCKVTKIAEFITPDNLNLIFDLNPDYIIDCIDTVKTKKYLIKECLKRKVKFIVATGMGNKKDASRIKITDLSKTSYDKIAKELRLFVKKEKIKGKIPVIFSDEQPITTEKVISSIVYVPAVAGLLCANYVINDIIKVK